MPDQELNEDELLAAWQEAKEEVAAALQNERDASHRQATAANRLTEARRDEAAVWKALEAYRTKVVSGRG
jgi:hypothetical protein